VLAQSNAPGGLDDRNQFTGNGDDALALEASATQQLFPFDSAALFASSNSQHVYVAHQLVF
jgi:hypothetical protein